MEYATPVWHNSVNKEESIQIERVQKSALRIILCGSYQSYKNEPEHMQLDTLYTVEGKASVSNLQGNV